MAYGVDEQTTRRVVTIPYIKGKKAKGEPVSMLTCYDYPTACLQEEAGIEMILVGDSMGMTVYGYSGTIPVTLEQMIVHSEAVKRGAPHCFVVGDMPFATYQISPEQAATNACRLVKEAGVDAIKLEGGMEMLGQIRSISDAGVPVMGHIGLTPQSATSLGGFKAQGRDVAGAIKLIKAAKAIETAGAFALCLEALPAELGKIITEELTIPTVGIGAGGYTDVQLLVSHDILGFFGGHVAKFVKQYANLNEIIKGAVSSYINDVHTKQFPSADYCYPVDATVIEEIKDVLSKENL